MVCKRSAVDMMFVASRCVDVIEKRLWAQLVMSDQRAVLDLETYLIYA